MVRFCAMSFENQNKKKTKGLTKTRQQALTDGDDQSALHANECHCVINVY